MKTTTYFSMLSGIFLLPFAGLANGETLEDLKRRCAEQELQIEALETEVRQLRHDLGRESVEPLAENRDEQTVVTAEVSSQGSGATHTVQAGESLTKIARQHGTTSEVLEELNGLQDPGLILVGQKLRLPSQRAADVVNEPESSNHGKGSGERTHLVKEGETFYKIARIYGINPEELMKANAEIDPRQLRMDQKIVVPDKVTDRGAQRAEPDSKVAKTRESKPEVETPALDSGGTQTVLNHRRIVKVKIDEPIRFGDFAAKYSMDPERLNRLNGLDLASSRLLKEGSSLYVSAQPVE